MLGLETSHRGPFASDPSYSTEQGKSPTSDLSSKTRLPYACITGYGRSINRRPIGVACLVYVGLCTYVFRTYVNVVLTALVRKKYNNKMPLNTLQNQIKESVGLHNY